LTIVIPPEKTGTEKLSPGMFLIQLSDRDACCIDQFLSDLVFVQQYCHAEESGDAGIVYKR